MSFSPPCPQHHPWPTTDAQETLIEWLSQQISSYSPQISAHKCRILIFAFRNSTQSLCPKLYLKFQQCTRNSRNGCVWPTWETWTQAELENTWQILLLKACQSHESGMLLWQAHALLFKRSEDQSSMVQVSEPPFFQVLLYPKHSWCHSMHKLLMCWNINLLMTISHQLALEKGNCEMFLSTYLSFFHYACLSHKKKKKQWHLFQVWKWFVNPEKKMSSSEELRLAMSSNCGGWLISP